MAENKERLINEIQKPEEKRMVDLESGREQIILPREVKTWMEKVEETSQPSQMVTDDKTGQPILTPAAPVNPKIILPITQKTFVAGFKKAVDEAGRWLSTFIFRLIKIKKGNVKFKEE